MLLAPLSTECTPAPWWLQEACPASRAGWCSTLKRVKQGQTQEAQVTGFRKSQSCQGSKCLTDEKTEAQRRMALLGHRVTDSPVIIPHYLNQ